MIDDNDYGHHDDPGHSSRGWAQGKSSLEARCRCHRRLSRCSSGNSTAFLSPKAIQVTQKLFRNSKAHLKTTDNYFKLFPKIHLYIFHMSLRSQVPNHIFSFGTSKRWTASRRRTTAPSSSPSPSTSSHSCAQPNNQERWSPYQLTIVPGTKAYGTWHSKKIWF